MSTEEHPDAARIKADAARINALGGPAKLAERLGFDTTNGGVQRVQNWITRGIPSKVKVQYPDLFMDVQKSSRRPQRVAIAEAG